MDPARSEVVAKPMHLPVGVRNTALPDAFFQRSTLEVAPDLLGKYFVRRLGNEILGGFIVEVEAYHQDGDEAAHTYGGRTKRNTVMFNDGGFLYVYFTYGMHFCMNVVTEQQGTGAAVLIRAIEPVQGVAVMQKNRNNMKRERDLTNGPAKCCQALGIDRSLNGLKLGTGPISIYDATPIASHRIDRSKRIGIKKSTELDWRYTVKGNMFLSRSPGKTRLYNH